MESKTIDETFEILLNQNLQINTEILPLLQAQNRILAQDIKALKNLPSFDNSAMDGFALNSQDKNNILKIVASIFAGDSDEIEIKNGECAKIMTGARIPKGADCVIPFEEIEGGFNNKEQINAPKELRSGANIKNCGEEVLEGELLIKYGSALNADLLTLLATQGISNIKVFLPLKIAVFASGNELKEPWESAQSHQIYNSNATMVCAILKEANFNSIYGGILNDDLKSIKDALNGDFDVIFTTGGASKGEADFMRKALFELGAEILIPSVQIKPGKPVMVAKLKEKYIIALPGNPLAGGVVLRYLILPFLQKLSGNVDFKREIFYIKSAQNLKRKPRAELLLCNISDEVHFINNGKYGSAQVLPFCKANAFVILENECEIKKGDLLKVMPFRLS